MAAQPQPSPTTRPLQWSLSLPLCCDHKARSPPAGVRDCLGRCITQILHVCVCVCVCVGVAGDPPLSASRYLQVSTVPPRSVPPSCLHFLSISPSFPMHLTSLSLASCCSLSLSPPLFPPGGSMYNAVNDGVTSLQDFLHCSTLPPSPS